MGSLKSDRRDFFDRVDVVVVEVVAGTRSERTLLVLSNSSPVLSIAVAVAGASSILISGPFKFLYLVLFRFFLPPKAYSTSSSSTSHSNPNPFECECDELASPSLLLRPPVDFIDEPAVGDRLHPLPARYSYSSSNSESSSVYSIEGLLE